MSERAGVLAAPRNWTRAPSPPGQVIALALVVALSVLCAALLGSSADPRGLPESPRAGAPLPASAAPTGRLLSGGGPLAGQGPFMAGPAAAAAGKPGGDRLARAYGKQPLRFEENRGQTDPRVKYVSRGAGYALFLTPTEAVLSLTRGGRRPEHPGAPASTQPTNPVHDVVRMRLLDANAKPRIAGQGQLPGKSNYLQGDDARRRVTGVPGYAKVGYEGVYPGTDLLFYGRDDGRLEYDFALAPGADPARIALSFKGARRLSLDRRGDLIISTAGGRLRQPRPVVYQDVGGRRHRIAGRYVLKGKDRVGFSVGAYDTGRRLVIDPTLAYSTYLGGSSDDYGRGIAVDGAGNAYVTGQTQSTNFPTVQPVQSDAGDRDAFVTKLSPSGALIYSTYLGGSLADDGRGIAVDGAGSAYVTGQTGSPDFATGPGGPILLSGSGFVTKLSPSGDSLVYSNRLTNATEAIAVDGAGSAYVTGTQSRDVFVTKLSALGSLVYSKTFGGESTDIGRGIAVDGAGSAYLTGETDSFFSFPTTDDAVQVEQAGSTGWDAFVTKLSPSGSELIYSTYLGGTNAGTTSNRDDFGRAIAVDGDGNAYVTGGPTVFVTKLNATGSALMYSSKLKPGYGEGIAVDGAGSAYVTGSTAALDFPTVNPVQPARADPGGSSCTTCTDAFVTNLNASGSELFYSTYLGGTSPDGGEGIGVDSSGNAYVAGYTSSTNFPTANPAQGQQAGGRDAFVTKIAPGQIAIGDATVTEGDSGLLDATFTVSLSKQFATEVRVVYATADGTAASPGDYSSQSGTLTFAPGETAKTITVPVRGDTVDEFDERFSVKLTSPQNASLRDGQATGTIVDDDEPPTVSVGDASIVEGDSGEAHVTFTLSSSGPSDKGVSVSLRTADDSATQPGDYAPIYTGVGLGPETTQTISVPVQGDTVDEEDERFFVNLSDARNATISDGQGIGTIVDNDGPASGPGVSIGDATVSEGDSGTVNAAFTVTLAAQSTDEVRVAYATADDSARAPGDYSSQSGTLTFAPGETAKTIDVPVEGDTTDEWDPRFFVNLLNAENATISDGQGAGTIADDDEPPAASVDDQTVGEGDSGTVEATFTVSLSQPSGKFVAVGGNTNDDSAKQPGDYALTSAYMQFLPGETTKTVSVPVKGDTVDEEHERFFVDLSSSPYNATIGDGQGVGTIVDDDGPGAGPGVSIGDAAVTEGDSGQRDATFVVSLSKEFASEVRVAYASADDSAKQPGDYSSQSGTLTFEPGETAKTVAVPINGDTVDEDDERFTLRLSEPDKATVADGEGVATIADDDDPPTVSVDDKTVTEGDSGTVDAGFKVSLSAKSERQVKVSYASADDSAKQPGDYSSQSGTLTFEPGETAKTVAVPINGDTVDEDDERFFVNLSSARNATISDGRGAGWIVDNDGPATGPGVSIGDVTVSEGDSGTVNAAFTVTLSGRRAEEVRVSYASADDSAKQPGDYAATNGTLTFEPGETTKTVAVPINGDTVDEDDERFTLRLSEPDKATVADGEGVGTIADDDDPPTVSVDDKTVTEGDSGTVDAGFKVSLSAKSERQVKVSYASADDSAKQPGDYSSQSGTLTFEPGETAKTVAVPINGDTVDEDDERFTLRLSEPDKATVADGEGVGTIADDDDPPASTGGPGTTAGGGGTQPPAGGGGPSGAGAPAGDDSLQRALAAERDRARALRRCLSKARRLRGRLRRTASRRCQRRYGRTPGRVTDLSAKALSSSKIALSFRAPGSDRRRPPPARSYLIKQSRRPISSRRAFARATTLCRGACRFSPSPQRVGARLTFTVTGLRRRTTYYYAVVARDNVSGRLGPRSVVVRARTR